MASSNPVFAEKAKEIMQELSVHNKLAKQTLKKL